MSGKFKWAVEIPPAAEWFDLDRKQKMRQYMKVRFTAPVLYLVQQPDTSWVEEIYQEEKEITFPDVGDLEKTKATFTAAYPEATIIDISHIVMTE